MSKPKPHQYTSLWHGLPQLLNHLSVQILSKIDYFKNWQLTPITGGDNNRLYRATNPKHDLVIKFTIRDRRDRAGREYYSLYTLHQSGLDVAPQPIHLDRDTYAQPVVVYTWLEGQVKTTLAF